eukprot:jgi/Botrbrau1/4056/Bobra.152_3s0013.2
MLLLSATTQNLELREPPQIAGIEFCAAAAHLQGWQNEVLARLFCLTARKNCTSALTYPELAKLGPVKHNIATGRASAQGYTRRIVASRHA